MKYIAITFDDGRKNNFSNALPVLEAYRQKATFFITTGYVDGSWNGGSAWKSSDGAMTVEQVKELHRMGHEIALHGDTHTAEETDIMTSYDKLRQWGIQQDLFGFSVPCSNIDASQLEALKNKFGDKMLSYIRYGRNTDTTKLSSKILYGMYTVLKIQQAYSTFNKTNIFYDDFFVPSVVIRRGDDPKMILNFIDGLPDNSKCAFMLHSVLPTDSHLYNTDAWVWSDKSLKFFCDGLAQREDIVVDTLMNISEKKKDKPLENV